MLENAWSIEWRVFLLRSLQEGSEFLLIKLGEAQRVWREPRERACSYETFK